MPTGPTVPDTSAWVEFLRRTGSRANLGVRELLDRPDQIVVTGPVLLEMLAGARTRAERDRIRDLLARCRYEPVHDPIDYEDAARVYRTCRLAGHTLRGHVDCVVAALAMRIGARVLHANADFDVIAQHAPLELA